MVPGFNVRNTEMGAVLGLSQLKRLDENIEKRKKAFTVWLNELSSKLYRTDFEVEGASPYALVLVLNEPSIELRDKVEHLFKLCNVEFRRGLSGGGNQLRQPYLRHKKWNKEDFVNVEHITDFSWYIGLYPDLEHGKIKDLCKLLNQF
jgi:CDP-6-deoxy-D-xylo-4-hexulose-3-dehydrase